MWPDPTFRRCSEQRGTAMAGPASSFSHPPEPARLPRLRVMALSKHLLMVLLAAAALAGSRAQVVAPEVTVVQTTALPLAGAPTQQVTFSEARPIVSVTAEPPCTTVLEVRRLGERLPTRQQRLLGARARRWPPHASERRSGRALGPLRMHRPQSTRGGAVDALSACSSLGAAPTSMLRCVASRNRLTIPLRAGVGAAAPDHAGVNGQQDRPA